MDLDCYSLAGFSSFFEIAFGFNLAISVWGGALKTLRGNLTAHHDKAYRRVVIFATDQDVNGDVDALKHSVQKLIINFSKKCSSVIRVGRAWGMVTAGFLFYLLWIIGIDEGKNFDLCSGDLYGYTFLAVAPIPAVLLYMFCHYIWVYLRIYINMSFHRRLVQARSEIRDDAREAKRNYDNILRKE